MPRRARLLCESGIYHIMIGGNEKREYLFMTKIEPGFLKSEGDYEWSSYNSYNSENTLLPDDVSRNRPLTLE